MTPTEIIDQTLDILERHDLAAMALSAFNSALKSAHSIDHFRRDLVEEVFDLAEYAVVAGSVGLAVPTRLRKVYRIFTKDSAGNVLDEAFYNIGDKLELRNYFGFTEEHTYALFGPVLNIRGMSAGAAFVHVQYLAHPTYTYNPETLAWETNSWIALEAPETIVARLQHRLAQLTEDQNQINSAEKYMSLTRQELLANYSHEIMEHGS